MASDEPTMTMTMAAVVDDYLNDEEAGCLFDLDDHDGVGVVDGRLYYDCYQQQQGKLGTPDAGPPSPRLSECSTEIDGEDAGVSLSVHHASDCFSHGAAPPALAAERRQQQPRPPFGGGSSSGLLPPAVQTVEEVFSSLGAWRTDLRGKAAVDTTANAIVAVRQPEELSGLFYVYDLGLLARLHRAWRRSVPRVAPFYAVECNPDRGLLATLAALGAGFGCASGAEIEAVLGLVGARGASSRVVFGSPCKSPRDLALAAAHDIPTTFDSVDELHKIAAHAPSLRLVLHIRSGGPSEPSPSPPLLGRKHGAEMEEVVSLLVEALRLRLRVFGVSFHVGAQNTAPAYEAAIQQARVVFNVATQMGFSMSFLDIGGGMSCRVDEASGEVWLDEGSLPADAIGHSLALMFPEPHLTVVAEPGRFFAQHVGTLAAQIIGRRRRQTCSSGERLGGCEYWLADGLHGAFGSLRNSHDRGAAVTALASPLWSPHVDEPAPADPTCLEPSTLWGPTCDGLDCIQQGVNLPQLRAGDWLAFHGFGAHTIAGASDLNGIKVSTPHVAYVASQ